MFPDDSFSLPIRQGDFESFLRIG